MEIEGQSHGGDSFYVVFSDLLFTCMAIFVLLMMIFLVQVSAASVAEKENQKAAQEQMAQLTEALSQAQAAQEATEHDLAIEKARLAELERAVVARSIDIVVAVDTSKSMGEALAQLTGMIETIGKVLPQVAPQVRIGIVAYRKRENDTSLFAVFDLQPITAVPNSFQRLQAFVNGLRPEPALAPVKEAIQKALAMLDDSDNKSGCQALVLLGDVGPFEMDGQDEIQASERRDCQTATSDVHQWANQSTRRSVVSVFTRTPPKEEERDPIFQPSFEFFQGIAAAAGPSGNFTNDHGQMLGYLLEAVIRKD